MIFVHSDRLALHLFFGSFCTVYIKAILSAVSMLLLACCLVGYPKDRFNLVPMLCIHLKILLIYTERKSYRS